MITSHTYSSLQPGKHLLVTGAIHGNEPCGTVAINRIMKELQNGLLELLKGMVDLFIILSDDRV